ncbi:MAG: DUF4233 domain-containing protein [Propionibacteriaceae bacterium]|nr:DUF4233 domain-containing protein [Propionibacteriaceae bacterium]
MRLNDGNPMTKTLMLTLIFEVVVYVLAIPGMIQVNDVPLAPAFGFGIGAAVLAGIAGGMLGRRPIGWPLAWLAQVAGVALGFLTPWMFVVGGGFALLFAVEFLLGRRIEASR